MYKRPHMYRVVIGFVNMIFVWLASHNACKVRCSRMLASIRNMPLIVAHTPAWVQAVFPHIFTATDMLSI